MRATSAQPRKKGRATKPSRAERLFWSRGLGRLPSIVS